jgi:hypothetical protein
MGFLLYLLDLQNALVLMLNNLIICVLYQENSLG